MAKNKINVKEESNEILLSEKEVWDIVEYARSVSFSYGQTAYLNPMLVNQRLQDVTLNPSAATEALLTTAMTSPKENESNLQKFSDSFELTSMVYKRLISYLANMLSFDITYTSTAEKDDYLSPKYKKDLKTIESFLEKFEYKKELRIVIREMLRHDAYFGCMRDTGNKIILQELPSEYCKITGRWEGGFLFSFNMYWFLQPGTDIDMYPSFFKKKYKEIWGDSNKTRTYDPALPPEARGRSSWIYWIDIPSDLGVCFKLTPELATRLPYFTPLFNDLVLQPLVRSLQKNINMAAASKMIFGEVPMLNKEAKATVKDSMAISPDLLGKFMGLVKSAISEAVKVAAAPLQNIKGISFDGDNEMYDKYLRTALASSGINTNLIFSSNIKPNAIETQLSLNVDEQMMTVLYEQFNSFMDYFINKFTKTYKFYFEFEGTDFFLNRDARFDRAMDLLDKGIVMPQKIAAALGMKPAQFRKHMEESDAMKFVELLRNPSYLQQIKIAEMAQEGSKELAEIGQENSLEIAEVNKALSPPTSPADKGRPKKKISELGDEGVATRDGATNVGRGGKSR
jgi:hypothetical protein